MQILMAHIDGAAHAHPEDITIIILTGFVALAAVAVQFILRRN